MHIEETNLNSMRDERGLLESHSALAEEMTQPIPPFIEENKRLKR